MPVRVRSEEVLVRGPPLCDVGTDKFAAIEMHDETFHCASNDRDGTVAYCDGAKNKDGTGAAFVVYRDGRFSEARSHKLPDDWEVVECELVAMMWALDHLALSGVRRAVVFTDSKTALMILGSMTPVGRLSSVWQAFVPRLNMLDEVAFGWSPGHAGIAGNEMADVAAGRAARTGGADGQLVDFGLRAHGIARKKIMLEWRAWHEREGHHYYKRRPGGGPKHWIGLSRMDAFVLMRLRTGVVELSHANCVDGDDRFHVQKCDRFVEGRPTSDIFDDRCVPDWKKWWVRHWYLGMGIPRAAKYSDDVLVIGGNPFTREVFRMTPDGVVREETRLPCARCDKEDCDYLRCKLPMRPMPRKWVFTHGQKNVDRTRCHYCDKDVLPKNHWPQFPSHAEFMTRLFWQETAAKRHELPADLYNALVVWVGLNGEGRSLVSTCPMCDKGGYGPGGVVQHLGMRNGDRCFRKMEDLFLTWLGEFVEE